MNAHERKFFNQFIGKLVCKTSLKPFKSGNKFNYIKGVIKHKEMGVPAFVFQEDDSYVSVFSCRFLEL